MIDVTCDKDTVEFTVVPGKKKFVCPLIITNNSDEPVIFKIKTTNNQRYAVKPSMGCIPPKSDSSVSIILISDFMDNFKKVSDKFQMQWLAVPSDKDWTEEKLHEQWKVSRGKEQKKIMPVLLKESPAEFNVIPEAEREKEAESPYEKKKDSIPVFQSTLDFGATNSTNQNDSEDKDELIESLKNEKNKMESELARIRSELQSTEEKVGQEGFTAIHIFVVMVVSLFIGYWFS